MTKNGFYQRLEKKLREDKRFIDEGDNLIKGEVINKAYQLDEKLIELLSSEKEFIDFFFKKIKDLYVFDINKFVDSMEKNLLGSSYTQFSQKIGLTISNKFMKIREEVALVWPFKDCILEGGMTKEEEDRNEIFFNEILDKDEIDRLEDPKVLTNFNRFTAKGEEKVKDFNRDGKGTIKDNLIIKGNNLLTLHSLKKEFSGKIKIIYLDPPYNTELDSFAYNDKFSHSTWLTFMKNRLEVAKELLTDDGTIFVHLDWHESHYCKLLLDDIFGRDHLINEIIWCYTGPGSPKMRQFNRKHDTILWYRKGDTWTFNGEKIKIKSEVHVGGFNNEMTSDVSESYTSKGKIPEDWWYYKNKDELLQEIEQIYKENENFDNDDWLKIAVAARIRSDGRKRTGYLTEKPYKLMQRIIESSSNEGDIVLDFFAGAGTTGYMANQLKRQFILVEQLENTQKILKKRFGDIPYVFCELLKCNQEAIDKIQDAKNTVYLLKIWEEMCVNYFLNYDVNIKKFNDNKGDFEKLSLAEQKKKLVEMLDKNQLYVNLTEIEDSQYKVSKEDKELNKLFYKGR
ncbi:DNA methylase [Candidatus Woesearchaeota archaeon]|jgi:adenine-specific DNA-methyltransferase|nr:DNA methylase [Candidatus Woesearchaeota archaeon]